MTEATPPPQQFAEAIRRAVFDVVLRASSPDVVNLDFAGRQEERKALTDYATNQVLEALATQSAELAALRERLEIDPEAPGYDGIAARDETIRQLEKQIDALRAKGERMAEALDGVIAVADRKTDEFDRAKQALADWRGEG